MTLLIEFIQYIHSKGTFWPRNKLILQNKISVKPNTSVEFKFLYGSKEVMTGKREKCIQVLGDCFFLKTSWVFFQDSSYLWNECIMNYISLTVGCSLNWFVQTSFPTCTSLDQMKKIQQLLKRMKNLSSSQFPKETGCLFQCSKGSRQNIWSLLLRKRSDLSK